MLWTYKKFQRIWGWKGTRPSKVKHLLAQTILGKYLEQNRVISKTGPESIFACFLTAILKD